MTVTSFLTLAFAVTFTGPAYANLNQEVVTAEEIQSEPAMEQEETLPTPAAVKLAPVNNEAQYSDQELIVATPSAAASKASNRAKANAQNWNDNRSNSESSIIAPQTVVVEQAPVQAQAVEMKTTAGSRIDQGIETKMSGIKTQFEDAIVRSLDKIQININDGSNTNNTTVVQDQVVNNNAAASAGYMTIEQAPVVKEEHKEEITSVVEAKEEEEESALSKVRLAPIFGMTTINSEIYDVDARYTAGFNIEVDVSENLAAVLGYSYSQYDVSLGFGNPVYGFAMQNQNQSKLQYNQNLFEGLMRFYLFPRDSKFRAHIGGGLGYNKGYLNYKKNVFNTFAYNPYSNLEDYEVTSFLGIMEAGLEFNVSKQVALGGIFKYANVLSSDENQRLNNYGFVNNGYGNAISPDQSIVGGSLAEDSFYSILGTVKVSF